MTPNTPSAFLGQPPGGAYHIPPTPPSQTHQGRIAYAPRAAARLTVRGDGLVLLNAEAARLLPDGDGTIDLRAPIREGRGDAWHLDCRPGGLYRRLPVGTTGGVRFKAAVRTQAMLGASGGPLCFELEHVGNGLFRLFTVAVNK